MASMPDARLVRAFAAALDDGRAPTIEAVLREDGVDADVFGEALRELWNGLALARLEDAFDAFDAFEAIRLASLDLGLAMFRAGRAYERPEPADVPRPILCGRCGWGVVPGAQRCFNCNAEVWNG